DRDVGRSTAFQELRDVVGVVPRRDDEEATGVFDAVGHDAPQHPVLLDAFHGGLRVFHHVAATRVEEAVEPPGRAVGQVALFHQYGVEATHGEVPQDAGSRRSTTDDEHLGVD